MWTRSITRKERKRGEGRKKKEGEGFQMKKSCLYYAIIV